MSMRIVYALGFALILTGSPAAFAQTSQPSTQSSSSSGQSTTKHTTTKHKTTKHTAATQPKTHTVCEDVTVQDQPKDSNQIAGMAIGGVAGGLLGNQIGSGKGRTLATVAGAVGGGYAGKKIQENQQAKNTHVERRCHEVTP
ncbi:glycine zipper 2TM domain-containing protein [Dyella koreensis]